MRYCLPVLIAVAMVVGATAAGAAPEWTISANPRPADSRPGQNSLLGVSCVTRTDCFAVGHYVNTAGSLRTLVEHWNGSSWRVVPSPNAPGSGSSLTSVSCSSHASCFAVGVRNAAGVDRALIARWNGTTWFLVTSPNVTGSVKLSGVSCASPYSCFAVGNYETGPARTVIERWNGTSWSIVASPNPVSVDTELNGVSCASPTRCFAVGNFTAGNVPRTLTERWDGSRWSIVPSPNPVGATSSLLFGVACVTSAACVAVGSRFTHTTQRTLIERWDGTHWTILASPNPGSGLDGLLGVTCVNRNSCTAVGVRRATSEPVRTLVVKWQGTRWMGVSSPSPAVAASSQLTGVSCSVATSCFAVGEYQQSGLSHMLIERRSLHAGYWMVDANGHLYAFGDAGVATPSYPGHPVAIAATEIGHEQAYWIVDANGRVQGGLRGRASRATPALRPFEVVTSISGTRSGHGYWLFTNLGRALPYGDARFFGDMRNTVLNGLIVASAATPSGHGYYMVGSDGGVFTFGDARFRGSTGSMQLNRPVVGIAPTPDNRGYWLVASDGGVFSFNARFRGSMGGIPLSRPVVGMVAYGNGYLLVGSDGGIFTFSDKPFAGSLGAHPPRAAVVGVAAFVD